MAAIQQHLTATPLSGYDSAYAPPENVDLHPDWPQGQEVGATSTTSPPSSTGICTTRACRTTSRALEDNDLLAELADAGWAPDKKLDLAELSDSDRKVWETAWPKALTIIEVDLGGKPVNGWNIARTGMGSYGTDYDRRALVAHGGLGANLPEDAIYPNTGVDVNRAMLNSDRNYLLHFGADELPPVHAFWSLTMYNDKGFFIANPLNRYAVRGETLDKNQDGSVDVYIQRQNPGPARESNWLPAPNAGEFNLMLRLYWPDTKILDGNWNPPGAKIAT